MTTPTLPLPVSPSALLEMDDEALDDALAALSTPLAARAVALAPSLEGKTRLLWAMEDRQRREVLQSTPAPLVAALIENLEEDNRYLLGDLGVDPFRQLLALCSAEQQFYWLRTSLSFADARANALPFFCGPDELAEILLTRPAFVSHVLTLADFPVEHQRVPPELMVDPGRALLYLFGSEGLLQEFPVADESLRTILQTLLDWDIDAYVWIIRSALRRLNYEANHPEEAEVLTEEPIFLEALEEPTPPSSAPRSRAAAAAPPLELALMGQSSLLRVAEANLSEDRRQSLKWELQSLAIREAVATGGSFKRDHLEAVASSIEAYLTLGLRALSSTDPAGAASRLESTPLEFLREAGAREVERVRQVALRMAPHEPALDSRHRAIVRSFLPPRLALTDAGEPVLRLRSGADLPAEIPVGQAPELLREVSEWIDFARALKLRHVTAAFQTGQDRIALLAALAVGAALFGRVEIGLIEADDYQTFAARYLTAKKRQPSRRAWEAIRSAVESWPDAGELPAETVVRYLSLGMERVGQLAREGRLTTPALHAGGYVPRPASDEPAGD